MGVSAIGVDGAPGGWVAASLDERSGATALALRRTFAEVAQDRGDAPVAVDIPIGLPSAPRFRACDVAARERLGARRSAVFAPLPRAVLGLGSYAAMREWVARERVRGISAQAAALAPKIAEVDAFARAHPGAEAWLYECHPELSWLTLGEPIAQGKATAAGLLERLRRARAAFPDAEERIAALPAGAALADALDAYAALATARRIARGEHEVLGSGERDEAGGLPMRIAT